MKLNWSSILVGAFTVYHELATGGAKDEADKIAAILGALIETQTSAAPPA